MRTVAPVSPGEMLEEDVLSREEQQVPSVSWASMC
jgi:hypothetical protein